MSLTRPATLSPSKVSTFRDCALAFRYSAIDRLPEAPSVPASRGTLVHAALERLLDLPASERTVGRAVGCLEEATEAFRADDDFIGLHLDEAAEATFLAEAEALVRRYFELEDPTTVRPIGLELLLEARIGDLRLRGIIDRLELDEDGGLVVTDYKTGRAPSVQVEQARLGGVHFYAYLCEQFFGVRPARIQLLHLAEPVAIVSIPTEQSTRGLARRVEAIWAAVERACEDEDFRPRPGRSCSWCSFHAYCPAQGGDPALAPTRAPVESSVESSVAVRAGTGRAVTAPDGPDDLAERLGPDDPGIAEVAPSPADAFAPVAAFDAAVDRAFDQLRGNPVADRVMYSASALGDFSLIWALLGSARSLRSERDEQAFLRLVVCLAGESLLVNQGIKRLFRRTRPVVTTERPHHLRSPLTTSFPSGHASSGAFAAVLLSDGSRAPAVWFLVALVVAGSRIHVRIHHASDIVAGAALGTVLGLVARRLWRLPPRR